MIRVTLLKGEAGFHGFDCIGHAGYAKAGRDIVCAGVSALTITCANALESVAGLSPKTAFSDGNLSVRLSPEEASSHDAQVLFKALLQGISDLSAEYPQYVQLTQKSIMEE